MRRSNFAKEGNFLFESVCVGVVICTRGCCGICTRRCRACYAWQASCCI